jgi:hypothetical protein
MKKELKALEKAGRKLYPDASRLRRDIKRSEEFLRNNAKRLKELTGRLGKAKQKAAEAITKLQGKIAKQVARAMEKKAVATLARGLAKVVPVLNLVSTIIDIAELTVLFAQLLSGDYGGAGDDPDGAGDDPDEAEDQEGIEGRPPATTSSDEAIGDQDGTAPVAPERKKDERRPGELSPVAKSVLEAVTHKGPGPQLDADQRMMIGLLVPSDLTPAELAEVISQLTSAMSKAMSAEDVIVAVSNAVKDVRARTRKQSITVNGVPATTMGSSDEDATKDDETEPTRSTGEPGPITSPDQLGPITALEIVQTGEPAVISRWFEVKDDALVLSSEGRAWADAHRMQKLAAHTRLASVEHVVRKVGDLWDLSVTFQLDVDGARASETHGFFVIRGLQSHSIGARHGDLTFEPYEVVTTE